MAARLPITIGPNGEFQELSSSDILSVTASTGFADPAIAPVGVADAGVVLSDSAVGLVLGGTLVFSALEFGASQFLTFFGTSAVFNLSNVITMQAGGGTARFDLGPAQVQLEHASGAEVAIRSTGDNARVQFISSLGGYIAFDVQPNKSSADFKLMTADGSNGDPIVTDGTGTLAFEPRGGTAFPLTSLYAGRSFWRTDLARGFHYDGTEWLGPPIPLFQGRNSQTNITGFQTLRLAGNIIPANSGGYPIPSDMKLLRVQMLSNNTGAPISGDLTVRVNNVILYTRVLSAENSVDEDGLDIDLPSSAVGGLRALFNLTGGTLNDLSIVMWVCERRTT